MNELAKTPIAPPARRAVRPGEVATQVLASENGMLSAWGPPQRAFAAYVATCKLPDDMPDHARVQFCLDKLSTTAELETLQADVERMLTTSCDDRVNRIFLGLLVDSYPVARDGQLEIFLEAVVNDLRELHFAPIIVAEALQTLRRTSKFRPSVAEVLAQCSEVAQTRAGWRSMFRTMIEARRKAERAKGTIGGAQGVQHTQR